MVGGLLARLEALLDDLVALDVDTLGDGELHQMVVSLSRCDTRLEAALCRLIGRWDRRQIWADNGSKAAGARLARETHQRRGDADRLVRRARDLGAMPAPRRRTSPARSMARTSISLRRATDRGATPSSSTAQRCSSTCAEPRSSPSPTAVSSTGSSAPTGMPPTGMPMPCAHHDTCRRRRHGAAPSLSTACSTRSAERPSRQNWSASANSCGSRTSVTASNALHGSVAPMPWWRWRCGRPPPLPTGCDRGRCSP